MKALVLLPLTLYVASVTSCSDAKKGSSDTAGSGTKNDASKAQPGCPPSADATQKFKSCREAKNDADCRSLGGKWDKIPYGISGGQRDACVCEIPDRGCACSKASDCIDVCFLASDWKDCRPGPGTCGPYRDSCYCFLDEHDKPAGICVN
jgi:hypothetical protein